MSESWIYGFIGGVLIGLGSLLALLATRKIPGISGVVGRLFVASTDDKLWRIVFLVGLISGAGLLFVFSDEASQYALPPGRNLFLYALAGLVVGFGTRLGGGCTSGHGVCGMGMGMKDSFIATVVFMLAGFGTVFLFTLFASGS